MRKIIKLFSILFITSCLFPANIYAQDLKTKYQYTEKGLVKKYYEDSLLKSEILVLAPELVFKGKYEINTESGESRFSVRNSRIGLLGNLNTFISYKFMLELSSEGKFNVLDLYAKFKPAKGFTITLGQGAIPLYNGYTISPGPLNFANRPFVGKYFASTRDIGLTAKYVIKQKGFPIAVEAGVYNGTGINNPQWTNSPSYGGRIEFGQMSKGVRVTGKTYKTKKDNKDLLYYGADFRYKGSNYYIETEIMERYNLDEKNLSLFATYIQGGYTFPLKSKTLTGIEPVARWDAMGQDLSKRGFGVNRVTLGVNVLFNTKPLTTVLRFNYEQYFKNYQLPLFTTDEMDQNKATLEVLIYF